MRVSIAILYLLWASGAFVARGADEPPAPAPAGFKVPMEIFDRPPPDPNRPVATVNGRPIRALELERAAQARWSQIASRLAAADRSQAQARLVADTLEQLIQTQVLLQAAERAIPPATPAEIADARKRLTDALPAGKTLDDLLKAQQLTAADLDRELAAQVQVGKFLDQTAQASSPVTEEEARAFYGSHPGFFLQPEIAVVRQILFRLTPQASAADRETARRRANDARKRALSGEDFEQLAKTLSEESEEQRGKARPVVRGQSEEYRDLERVMFGQPLTVVSEAVESPLGIHLIRVDQRIPPRTIPFEEVREKLITDLTARSRQNAAATAFRKLREDAQVVYEAGFGPPAPPPAGGH